jgi:hypothetical protein
VTHIPAILRCVALVLALYACAAYGTERTKKDQAVLFYVIPAALSAAFYGGSFLAERLMPKRNDRLELCARLAYEYAAIGDQKGLDLSSQIALHEVSRETA